MRARGNVLCAQDGASEGAGAGSGNAVEGAGRRARQCSCSEHFGCVKMRIKERIDQVYTTIRTAVSQSLRGKNRIFLIGQGVEPVTIDFLGRWASRLALGKKKVAGG